MLVEAFLALGVVFVTLAIPLALDGRWTAATWALEGAAVVCGSGYARSAGLARIFGLLLQMGAGIAFFFAIDRLHGDHTGTQQLRRGMRAPRAGRPVLQLVPGSASRSPSKPRSAGLAGSMFAWGLAWWTGGGLHEIDQHVAGCYRPDAALLFIAGLSASLQRAVATHVLALMPSIPRLHSSH